MPLVVPGIMGGGGSPTEQWTNLLVGKKLSDSTSNETDFAKKDLPQNHRIIEQGGMATADFQENRLNIHLDKDGVVKQVSHG